MPERNRSWLGHSGDSSLNERHIEASRRKALDYLVGILGCQKATGTDKGGL